MQLKTFPLLYAMLMFALQPIDANNSNNYSAGDSTYTGSAENFRQKICIWGCGNRRS